jgi:hemerythrin-like domain-containing protein
MSFATDHLKKEHDAIVKMIDLLERVSWRLLKEETVPADHLDRILQFFQTFAAELHHGKEEEILFPAIDQVGIPAGGGPLCILFKGLQIERQQIQSLIEKELPPPPEVASSLTEGSPLHTVIKEHREGHLYRDRMREAVECLKKGDESGRELFVTNARKFVDLMREHVDKENRCLFVMVNSLLTEGVQRELERDFLKLEREKIGSEKVEICYKTLRDLSAIYLNGNQ